MEDVVVSAVSISAHANAAISTNSTWLQHCYCHLFITFTGKGADSFLAAWLVNEVMK